MPNPTRIVIVCGEASGDRLGAGLLAELKKLFPNTQFEGVGGPLLQRQGLKTWFDCEKISFMGFVDPILNIRTLYRAYKDICTRCIENPPDLFIGIDAPDFTLRIERKLKDKGIKTLHYVGPSVWAWRENRIHSIKKAVDHMLVLFPFETSIYEKNGIPVTCVGMKLADDIPIAAEINKKQQYRKMLEIDNRPVVTLLGGSRRGELKLLVPIILKIAKRVSESKNEVQFLVACLNAEAKTFWEKQVKVLAPDIRIKYFVGDTPKALIASDIVLAKSGTVTLETMLYKKPMVVIYKVSTLNYWIGRLLIRLKYFSLPNLLAGRQLIKEHIQKIDEDQVARELLGLLECTQSSLIDDFTQLHQQLALGADRKAALTVSRMVEENA